MLTCARLRLVPHERRDGGMSNCDSVLGLIPPPRKLKGLPDAVRTKPKTPRPGGGLRARWRDPNDGTIYEWDYQHGAVEVYDRNGIHRGERDPDSGLPTKGADSRRRIEP